MKLGVLGIALTLTACGFSEKGEMKETVPPGWKQFVTPGNHITYVIPVEVNGVKCVVVSANEGGRGVSCDWVPKYEVRNP